MSLLLIIDNLRCIHLKLLGKSLSEVLGLSGVNALVCLSLFRFFDEGFFFLDCSDRPVEKEVQSIHYTGLALI